LNAVLGDTLAKRTFKFELNTTTDAATVIRTIHTPWPLTAALTAISFILAFIAVFHTRIEQEKVRQLRTGSRPRPLAAVLQPPATTGMMGLRPRGRLFTDEGATQKRGLPISALAAVVWTINFVRAAIALAYLLVDLGHGAGNFAMPSVGAAILFSTLLANALHNYQGALVRLAGRVSLAVAAVGLLLYVVNGVLTWDRGSALTDSVEVIVAKGCAGQLFQNEILVGPWLCPQLQSNQVFFQHTGGDTAFQVAWVCGVFLFGLLFAMPFFLTFYAATSHRRIRCGIRTGRGGSLLLC
jgi:hypothetical protein